MRRLTWRYFSCRDEARSRLIDLMVTVKLAGSLPLLFSLNLSFFSLVWIMDHSSSFLMYDKVDMNIRMFDLYILSLQRGTFIDYHRNLLMAVIELPK